jgi:hypothetical protein
MRSWSQTLARLGVVVVTVLALCAGPVSAQDKDETIWREPGISYLPERSPYIEWIAATVMIIGCLLGGVARIARYPLD